MANMHLRLKLLVAMLLTVWLALSGSAFCQEPEEQTAIAHLRSIGAEFEFVDGKASHVNFLRSSASDSDTAHLAAIKSLKSIDFGQRKFSDKTLQHVAALPNLRSVNLSLCPITDKDLRY